MKVQKRLNICLTVALYVAVALSGIFAFSQSYARLLEALIGLYDSFIYYFKTLFGIQTDSLPSVTKYSEALKFQINLPSDINGFKSNAAAYFSRFFSKENFMSWLKFIGEKTSIIAKVITIILPCVILLAVIIRRLYATENNKYNVDTVPLKLFKKLSEVTYQPIKKFICGYINFLRARSWIYVLWLVLWALNFNLISIVVAFFAYYFYFAVSFDILGLYVQIVKLVIDLQPLFRFFPWWSLSIAAYYLLYNFRKKIALNRLRHFEAKNCGFINELPIVSMACGSMGKKKTTLITDMTLSQEVMFRQKALSILQENDMKFPHFPWILFEKELQKCMEYHTVL